MLLFALLDIAGPILAADPFVGTWKLASEKSWYQIGTPPKEQILTIAEVGRDLDVTITGTSRDHIPISMQYTAPLAGRTGRLSNLRLMPFRVGPWERIGERLRTQGGAGSSSRLEVEFPQHGIRSQ